MNRTFVAILIAFIPASGYAQSMHQTMPGNHLDLGMPCAREIAIAADPSLSGQAVLEAEASHQEEIDRIQFSGGDTVKLKLHGDCWRPYGDISFEPTLRIKLSVPPGFPTAVEAAGSGDIHIDVGGPLTLDSSGSSRVDATSVTSLNIDVGGSGNVDFRKVAGPVSASLSGSGDVSVAEAIASAMTIESSGSGTFKVADGTIGDLVVNTGGSGEILLGGTVGSAVVESSGSGDVTIARLTGHLTRSQSGSGEIEIYSGK